MDTPQVYLDRTAKNIPLSIDWSAWLSKLGTGLTITVVSASAESPVTVTSTVVGTKVYLTTSMNNASLGRYTIICTVRANNTLATEDTRHVWVYAIDN